MQKIDQAKEKIDQAIEKLSTVSIDNVTVENSEAAKRLTNIYESLVAQSQALSELSSMLGE